MNARILFVDDEPDLEALILQKFRHHIRDGTAKFLFAHDGIEALAALKANDDIDLVVTDINMPRMDGLSLLQKLQESEDRVSTIIVSAYGDMANIRTAMNRGAFDFVTKPIDFGDLETTITKTLRHVEFLRDARAAPGGGRTGARFAVAVFLAQPGATARQRGSREQSSRGSGAKSRRCSRTSPVSPRSWKRWNRACSGRCSTSISPA